MGPHAGPGGQSGQDRQPLPGPLVHPGLALQTVCPVRDVLVDYLAERQVTMDFSCPQHYAYLLGKLFWADIEAHHPAISSLKHRPAG